MEKVILPASLVVTTYNEADNILTWCKSLVGMDCIPGEIVVVDSLSSDNTVELISKYLSKYEIDVNIIVEECNISRGRNIAIRAAKYEKILVTDAGVTFDKHWAERIYAGLHGHDVVAGYYFYAGNGLMQKAYRDLFYTAAENIDGEKFLPSSRSLGILKSAWLAVEGYNESLDIGEDTDFDLRLKNKGYKFNFVGDAIVYWVTRKHLSAIAKQNFLYSFWDSKNRQNVLMHLNMSAYILALFIFFFLINYIASFIIAFGVLLVLMCIKPLLNLINRNSLNRRFLLNILVMHVTYLSKVMGFIFGRVKAGISV